MNIVFCCHVFLMAEHVGFLINFYLFKQALSICGLVCSMAEQYPVQVSRLTVKSLSCLLEHLTIVWGVTR